MKIHIGTYTIGTESKGIYRLNQNKAGELTMEDVFLHTENPSFLVSKPGMDLLYAVSEMKEQAAVTTCRVDAEGRFLSCSGFPVKEAPCASCPFYWVLRCWVPVMIAAVCFATGRRSA